MKRPFRVRLLKFAPLLLAAIVAMWGLHPRHGPDRSPVRLETLQRHVARVAAQPHPTGSDANRQVREYILAELDRLGLRPEIITHEFLDVRGEELEVENIVCSIGGTRTGGPGLYLATHYDSSPRAPGAGDAGASVAAILETARLLVEQPPLNTVTLLITDGEEAGLLGARGWEMHREMYPPCDLVLNFDARGTAGPSVMFETSRLTPALLSAYADGAAQPVTSSLADAVYRRMPNATDFTIFASAGVRGLNFAFLDGVHRYHTPHDVPANLSDATLLHHARQMHSVLRSTDASPEAFRDAPERSLVYFDLLGLGLVRYATPLAVVASTLACLLLGAACWRDLPTLRGTIRAGIVCLASLLALAGWTHLVTYLLAQTLIDAAAFQAANAWLWLVFSAAAVLAFLLVRHAGRLTPSCHDRLIATAALFCLAAIATAILLPSGSYLFTWPALLMSGAALLPRGRWRNAALGVAAVGATVILLPMAWHVSVALTVRLLAPGVAVLVLLAWTWEQVPGWRCAGDHAPSTIPPAAAASPALRESRKSMSR